MCLRIKQSLRLYIYIILALVYPSECIKFLNPGDETHQTDLILIQDFREHYLEAFCVTLTCIFIAYLLAGFPAQISWNKLLPTLLIGLPVYGTRFATMTWGGDGIGEEMDKLFFKTLYVIGITWLSYARKLCTAVN